ncbi:oxygen-independent coproporphyrinogen III oxidase [Magnetofaba australis]|uniref:Coproporphyrinogen-III oxidase n=1 Tax=Magnetofaba australis IT-1 TaxID=1434232 RepID=A0A1Y2K037_9PROT|nr:oxygen-independent coproporphyrinogen III oxidase [Magnetofaba australis]OSM00476.1 putative coproporphyrinogen III oxidase [Magnetofaba australis IT-1]
MSSVVSQVVKFDRELIDRYNVSGPRYTSYPTAPHFKEGFTPDDFRAGVARSQAADPDKPLSLYFHIPFCDTVCYYCACNKVITPVREKAVPYLENLFKEIERMGRLFDRKRKVAQLHLGGGTPTYLDNDQLQALWDKVAENFTLAPDDEGEYSIECDPRELPVGAIAKLRKTGFNRLSVGLQDLDPVVQKAVNRVQSLELTKRVVDEAREAGYVSINLDLIYGLPFQTEAGFANTVEASIRDLDPDRLAVFNYAHLPQYFMPQRRINDADLPHPDVKLKILENTINQLTDAGHVYIGMDHFAKPDDELAMAQRNGVLHRNFQGYTTHAECDLVSMGATSISQIGDIYAQNRKELPEYYELIEAGDLAIFKGMRLSDDDMIRRDVIMRLICDFHLDRAATSERLGIDFSDYFGAEEADVKRMVGEGLLTDDGNRIEVTPGGRLLIRNICMPFDWHLRNAQQTKTFSKTI